MPTTKTLTTQEFDEFMTHLEAFLKRLRPTILATDRNQTIKAAVDSLHQLVAVEAAAKATAASTQHGAAPSPARAGQSPKGGKFDDAALLDFIRNAPGPVRRPVLISAFGVKPRQVKHRLQNLVARNLIRSTGKAGWTAVGAAGETAAANAPAAPRTKAAAPAKKPPASPTRRGTRPFSDTDLARVLELMAHNPGWRPEQFREAAKLDVLGFKYVVRKLKAMNQVQIHGAGKSTTYTVAGASAAPVVASAAPAASTPKKVPTPARKKRGHGSRAYTDADLAHVLNAIKAQPGLRRTHYFAESKLSPKAFDRVASKLKETKRIKAHGTGTGTTYTLA